jgi:hypothetical protein
MESICLCWLIVLQIIYPRIHLQTLLDTGKTFLWNIYACNTNHALYFISISSCSAKMAKISFTSSPFSSYSARLPYEVLGLYTASYWREDYTCFFEIRKLWIWILSLELLEVKEGILTSDLQIEVLDIFFNYELQKNELCAK